MEKDLIKIEKYVLNIVEKLIILDKKNHCKLEYLNGYIDAKLEKEKVN